MRLKLDENLGNRGAASLRAAGHDVATVPEQRLCSAPDRELIGRCAEEQRALVTLDLDFANPLVFDPRDHGGVAVLRLPHHPCPEDLSGVIETLISGLSRGDLAGRLWIVEKGRIREHQAEDSLGI